MGFLSQLFHGREIQRLERLAASAPAPSLFLRLAELYRDIEDPKRAESSIRRGAELFSDNQPLQEAKALLERGKLEAEKERLRHQLEQFPSAMVYARLAEVLLREDELQEAERICRRGCREYPEHGGLWTVMGKISLTRRDGVHALKYLREASRLDEYNYEALMLLAETLCREGERGEAREVLERILRFAPGDEEAHHFLRDFDSRAEALEQEGCPGDPEASPAAAGAEGSEGSPDRRHSSGVGTGLGVEIRQIRRVEGVQGTILVDPNGLVIASDLPEGMDEEMTAAHINNLLRSVHAGAEKLDLGEVSDGIVDTRSGSVHIHGVREMTMAVFAERQTKAGLLQRAIRIFSDRVLEMES